MKQKRPQGFVVMGVSGCGKTTVGEALAQELGCPFYDGDDFHPPENIVKMATGCRSIPRPTPRRKRGCLFVYLHGDFDTIWQRMQSRSGHYMKEDMLHSQFEALESLDRDEALWVDISESVTQIVTKIMRSQTV